MTPCEKRWATTYDLKNYFRKDELLGGLTELQYELLRANLGIDKVGEGGLLEPEETPFSTFSYKLRLKALITGGRYIISGFLSIYDNGFGIQGTDDSDNPSDKYTLLVTAVSRDMIDPRVIILEHPDWTVEYDPTPVRLSDGSTTLGTITYLRDTNNNVAPYDFKNIKFRRTNDVIKTISTAEYLDCYTFSDLIGGKIVDASETSTNTRNNIIDSYDNVFFGDTYDNHIFTDCTGNTFLKGCHSVSLEWDSRNNIFEEPVCFMSGSVSNRHIKLGTTVLSTTLTKLIHVVNNAHIVTYLDTITYAWQIDIL